MFHLPMLRPSSSSADIPVPVLTSDPTLLAVVEHCEQLAKSIHQLKAQEESSGQDGVPASSHPRECVPPSEQEVIIDWLGGINLVSSILVV
jgi:hypothetical protein